jgi:hypothetical protein
MDTMLAYTIIPHSAHAAGASCPRLGLAGDPGSHYAMPCSLNICHADPLRRKRPRDLPLSCQADCCLTDRFARCPYWQSAEGDHISLVRFLVRQLRAAYTVCARSLRP